MKTKKNWWTGRSNNFVKGKTENFDFREWPDKMTWLGYYWYFSRLGEKDIQLLAQLRENIVFTL